jgi:hypothetical protein
MLWSSPQVKFLALPNILQWIRGLTMNDQDVVVESVSGAIEAEILRGLLESFGLKVTLSQESAGRAIGLSVGPLGRVDLLVPADQAEKARRILADYRAGHLSETEEDQEAE